MVCMPRNVVSSEANKRTVWSQERRRQTQYPFFPSRTTSSPPPSYSKDPFAILSMAMDVVNMLYVLCVWYVLYVCPLRLYQLLRLVLRMAVPTAARRILRSTVATRVHMHVVEVNVCMFILGRLRIAVIDSLRKHKDTC